MSIILTYNHFNFNLINYGTNHGKFYEDVDVREISDSVGELMSGVLGGITEGFWQKKRYYGDSLN